MREFKFRAWCDFKKVMIPNYCFLNSDKHFEAFDLTNNIHGVTDVMQHTGLIDRNGKDIYEGDIVRWGTGGDGEYDQEAWHRYAVVEINSDIQFRIIYYIEAKTGDKKPTDNYVFRYGNFMYKDYLHVIGNIHQNPELIGKEALNG